jgi:hypothetical protein
LFFLICRDQTNDCTVCLELRERGFKLPCARSRPNRSYQID